MEKISAIYQKLLDFYGPQGWWPLSRLQPSYHLKDYSYPQTNLDRFEICLGAILTQNTSWANVEKCLQSLYQNKLLIPEVLLAQSGEKLSELIRTTGYHRQKAKKIKIFTEFYLQKKDDTPTREEVLSLWGIGEETADSILLYAYNMSTFVIDAYTRRMLISLNLIEEKWNYAQVQNLMIENLPKDISLYQEFHALIVRHGKEFYQGKGAHAPSPLFS